jgi:acetyl esterase/lipase
MSDKLMLTAAFLVLSALYTLEDASAEDSKIKTSSYVYKKVDDLEIRAEVYRKDDGEQKPVVVWIHGGALINGHRESVPDRLKQGLVDAGYVIVSIDYRLAPETKLPEIIQDVEDAFAWIRKDGPQLFQADPKRIAVMGGSAGGYLTLTTGFRVDPRPNVLVSFWGYGELIGDWYSTPSPHKRHHQSQLSEAEARRQVTGPPVSDSRQRKGDGGAFYQFCRQKGIWPEEVSGWDPKADPEKFMPYMPVKNVTKDYPPTLLIHGTKDTDVPYEQSALMAEEFKNHNIHYQLFSIPNAEHGLAGGDPKLIDEAYDAVVPFLNRFMK